MSPDAADSPFDERPASVSYVQLVPAVEQATRILGALARTPDGSATLTEICRAVDLNKSKGLAILNTLRRAGLVTKNERSKTYGLGLTLLSLSRALLDHTDLAHEASPYLEHVADATESTALLGLVSGQQLFIVARREAAAGVGITVQVGHRFPLTWGAHGKAILAALPDEECGRILTQKPLYVHGEAAKNDVDLAVLRAELEQCRHDGFAHDLGVTRPGVRAVSAVVVGGPPSGPSSGGPASRIAGCLVAVGTFAAERAPRNGSIVADAARQMSVRLESLL